MDFETLAIVAGVLPAIMLCLRAVIKSLVGTQDVYVLSNREGRKVQVVLDKHASEAERAAIINRKVRELEQTA
ncbi:hypothetical protein [Pseudoduganella armeniaca]|uniref:Uncharacterized protein n=1 Tax=Pseudoduganella armeniaca TaxID=2072590 RepID=A0A2R4CDL7_9BURK|nr:hypothetical protein [Pseudoduganella armeniaca]AVR97737.1 hypothetical protein C9I28_20440 [Pseudoduganella armeniaca]